MSTEKVTIYVPLEKEEYERAALELSEKVVKLDEMTIRHKNERAAMKEEREELEQNILDLSQAIQRGQGTRVLTCKIEYEGSEAIQYDVATGMEVGRRAIRDDEKQMSLVTEE